MRLLLLLTFMSLSIACFAKRKFVLISDSISISFIVKHDSLNIFEEIEVQNLSRRSIYIPQIDDRGNYFFVINNILFSHLGIMASKFGTPNLSLEMKLIEIPTLEKYPVSLKIKTKLPDIHEYYFSFDYLSNINSAVKIDNNFYLYTKEYILLQKYVLSHMEGL